MVIDPQVNPLIVFPALIALVLIYVLLRWKQMDGRLQGSVLILIGFVVIFFLLSRTPLF